ncbi:hypothetical protein [Evansella cellulosilytica]|uniref:DUF7847 domain-containing protein n=1 Tax=Evansella cellulosilytica (strain ATCC 21833 / DSM 2522 / FERM P-1141 / JCM 9156 / N-4) TaxID=649639 RepID=E6TZ29_EVAC2|nr:hypothetical protein [Evansella cellulosilytica]ADU32472.1 hypothetical protein Bcell_4245 [Evansella cellulosilytica DSM 2522]
MKDRLNKPKGFGEILDVTFSLSKKHFINFFKIFLFLIGPVILIEALIRAAFGTSLIRDVAGGTFLEQFTSVFDDPEPYATSEIIADLWIALVSFISLFLYPIAYAAIILAVNRIRKGEEYTVGGVIKQAFSRFWPIIGSSILFFLILFGMIIVPNIALLFIGVIGILIHPVIGVILVFIFGLAAFIGLGLLLTRWAFFLGSVVLKEESPGLSRSWQLTRGRMWASFGLIIVFTLIISLVGLAFEFSFMALLGHSVLFFTVMNLIMLVTQMITAVAYSVVYTDLKTRHDAEDIKDLLENYNGSIQE